MATLDNLPINPFSQSSDEDLLKRLLEIRRQRRTTPAKKQAKAAAKTSSKKKPADLMHLLANGASPDQLDSLIEALQAKLAKE